MREAWKRETYVRSQSFSSESAVKYLHVGRRKIQISPPPGEQDQSNVLPLGQQRQSNPHSMPCLPPPPPTPCCLTLIGASPTQAWNKAKISPYTPLKTALPKRENHSTNNAFWLVESRDAYRLLLSLSTYYLNGNPGIPGGIQMERLIPVEIFREKSNTFRGIPFSPFLAKRTKFSVPFV